MHLALGGPDTTLDTHTGALIVDVSVESMPGVHDAQVSLLRGGKEIDANHLDSAIKVRVPAGRYLFRARRLGAQILRDSVSVRAGFADTVNVVLGRDVACLQAQTQTR